MVLKLTLLPFCDPTKLKTQKRDGGENMALLLATTGDEMAVDGGGGGSDDVLRRGSSKWV
ncbi:uncharacterized protein G2W53_003859 [Senna tora]|uniref:Uncharacterized protein n=1 Tax=Senna tora TaxID=362788 RepID=A0A835CHE7_9FABA|nr:uncharacterized protein G2W53_003859 [Senna tora]